MTARRRAVLLSGLALLLGGLAASDVARRERALHDELGPVVAVVVARADLASGRRVGPQDLSLKRVPERFLPPGVLRDPTGVGGELAVPVTRGNYVTPEQFAVRDAGPASAPVARGQRLAQVVAVAPPELVVAHARVDVVITTAGDDRAAGRTALAFQDVEVVDARPAPPADGAAGALPRVAAMLRVPLRDALTLAAAQGSAREIRLLPRPAGDRRRLTDDVTGGT